MPPIMTYWKQVSSDAHRVPRPAADVVDYSRLMGLEEAGTLSALRRIGGRRADAKIAEHQGRIVKLTGDGIPAL